MEQGMYFACHDVHRGSLPGLKARGGEYPSSDPPVGQKIIHLGIEDLVIVRCSDDVSHLERNAGIISES